MKKIICLVISAAIALSACSGSNKKEENPVQAQPAPQQHKFSENLSEAQKLLQSVPFTNDGIKKLFKSDTEMTAVEYEAWLMAYEKCSFTDGKIKSDTCPPQSIYIDVKNRKLEREERNKVHFKLMGNKRDILRYVGARDLDIYPNEEDLQMKSFELCKKEKNGYVLASMMRGLYHAAPQNDEVREYLKSQVTNENEEVRRAAANHLSSPEVLEGHPDLLEPLMAMCTKDASVGVSFYACQGVGGMHDDSVIPALVEVLNDPEQAARHVDITRALVKMWLDFPNYEHTSKDAYTAYMNYIKTKPRTGSIPADEALRINSLVDTSDNYKAWQKKAKYFKLKDYLNACAEVAKDDNASLGARKTAIEMIRDWGTAKDLKALSKAIDASQVSGIESVQELLKQSIEEKK